MSEENNNLPNCSDQFKDYVHKACKIVDDVCDIKTLPLDEIEALRETLTLIPKSKKNQDEAMKILEDYIKDDKECKI